MHRKILSVPSSQGNAGEEQTMVRISDLIKGKVPTAAPAEHAQDPRTDTIRMRNISGLGNVEAARVPGEIASGYTPERQSGSEEASPGQPTPLHNGAFSSDSRNIYLHCLNHLQELRGKLDAGKPIDLQLPLAMIERIIADPSVLGELYQLTLACEHSGDMYIASPLNSMIYSYKIGVRMGYTPAMLTDISLAALHHDVGMFLMPESIVHKDGKLSESEFAAIKKHTATGRDLFISLGYPNVARAVYEHHERECGQGYPLCLRGDAISEYAKIIGICDSYEAMTHDRPHKKAAAQYSSVLQLAGSKDLLFAPHIVKIFLDEITLYPIGSYVRLNNQAIGLVVQTNPGKPLKPVIRIVVDGHGKRTTEEKLIDLSGNTILTIVAGVAADELPV